MLRDSEVVTSADPNMDLEAKHALWKATVRKAQQLRREWGVSAFLSKDRSEPIANNVSLPSCDIWKLVEILSVFTVLFDADEVINADVFNLRGMITKPVFFRKDGEPYYLSAPLPSELPSSGWPHPIPFRRTKH